MSKPEYKESVILREEEEGGYSLQCVELPGCISEGETREEALKNIKEAIIGYFPEDQELINIYNEDDFNKIILSKKGIEKLIDFIKHPDEKNTKILKESKLILDDNQVKNFGKEPIKVNISFKLKERM